jgi:hypothetical protein
MTIKSRRIRWVGHAARRERLEKHTQLLSENLNGRDQLQDLDKDGRKIPEFILKKEDRKLLIGFVWLRIRRTSGRL